MLILNDWHPDILSFISSKRKAGNITNANISVGISDKFMEAVKSDSDWALVFPDTSHSAYNSEWDGDIEQWQDKGYPVITHKTVKAREVWDAIIESAWASAEPGLWFRERANKMSNSYYYPQGKLINTNPCGEQSLPAWGSCNLGAINLSKFTNADKTDVDWYELGQAVRYAVRFLDNVLDLSHYHIQDNEHQSRSERRIGLGIMGLAELLIQLKIKYGSDEGVKLTEEIFKFMTINAYHASSDNALEKGAFEWYDERLLDSGFALQLPDDLRQKIFNQGLRNVTLITVAPTGTTGSLVNTSTGIEPFFAWEYYRKGRLGTYEVEPLDFVRKYQEEHPDEPLPEYFVTAMELTPYEHVRMQASAQKWTDSSISKTVNCPNEWTQAQVDELYMFMYNSGCKGGTIYRDGSRDEQVLYTKKDTDDKSTSNTDTEQSDTLTPTPTIWLCPQLEHLWSKLNEKKYCMATPIKAIRLMAQRSLLSMNFRVAFHTKSLSRLASLVATLWHKPKH